MNKTILIALVGSTFIELRGKILYNKQISIN